MTQVCRNCGRTIEPFASDEGTWWVHTEDRMLVCVDNQRASHLTVGQPETAEMSHV